MRHDCVQQYIEIWHLGSIIGISEFIIDII
jgi:hypothetical protein